MSILRREREYYRFSYSILDFLQIDFLSDSCGREYSNYESHRIRTEKMYRIIQICPILKFKSNQFSRTSIEKNEHFLLFINIVYLDEMFRLRDQFSVFGKSSHLVFK